MFKNWWLRYKYNRIRYDEDHDVLDVLIQYLKLIRMYSLDKVRYKQRVENSYLANTDTAGEFIKISHVILGNVSRGVSQIHKIPKLNDPLFKTNFDLWLTTADGDIDEKEFISKILPISSDIAICLKSYKDSDEVSYIYYKKALDLYLRMLITFFDILIRLQIGDNTDVPRHIHDLILRR